MVNGQIPPGLVVRHVCDEHLCVRNGSDGQESHLITGTQAENIADKVLRFRQARGESSASALLSEEQVREIRRLARETHDEFRISEIAERFEVSYSTIWDIVRRRSWQHVVGDDVKKEEGNE